MVLQYLNCLETFARKIKVPLFYIKRMLCLIYVSRYIQPPKAAFRLVVSIETALLSGAFFT